MATYEEMAQKAMEAGEAEYVSERQRKLAVGEVLIGKFVDREHMTSKDKNMPDFFRYHFEDDEGPVSYLFSQAFDKTSRERLVTGGIYYIKFDKVVALDAKRKFNDYTVVKVGHAEDVEKTPKAAE
jgi:hypothetical protein